MEESFIPYSERYLTLEIREAGTYMASMTTSAKTWVALSDCDAPFATYAGGQLNEPIELLPGRKRITIGTSTADEAVGEIVLRRPLTLGP